MTTATEISNQKNPLSCKVLPGDSVSVAFVYLSIDTGNRQVDVQQKYIMSFEQFKKFNAFPPLVLSGKIKKTK